jgi:hypothetical protein
MLRRLAHGCRLIVECTDPLAVIPHLLRETGDTLEQWPLYIPYQAWQGMREQFCPWPAGAAEQLL